MHIHNVYGISFIKIHYRILSLLLLGSDELVALAVYVDDFNLVVVLQVLAQLGDVNVHIERALK